MHVEALYTMHAIVESNTHTTTYMSSKQQNMSYCKRVACFKLNPNNEELHFIILPANIMQYLSQPGSWRS